MSRFVWVARPVKTGMRVLISSRLFAPAKAHVIRWILDDHRPFEINTEEDRDIRSVFEKLFSLEALVRVGFDEMGDIAMERVVVDGVALVGGRDGDVRFGFTERTGGVSVSPYASLNLGSHVGDDLDAVLENRRRVLLALCDVAPFGDFSGDFVPEGFDGLLRRLLVPNQVHGDHVAVVRSAEPAELDRVRAEIAQGADAIVCCAPAVPVMLCFADCVPVILTCPSGFAVIHSGWKGTYARIAGQAARVLMDETACAPDEIRAYIGPHILGDEYEVSEELIERFDARFGWHLAGTTRLLDLSRAIVQALVEVDVPAANICDPGLSTVRDNDRFFSYRAENGTCGRHAAVAVIA